MAGTGSLVRKSRMMCRSTAVIGPDGSWSARPTLTFCFDRFHVEHSLDVAVADLDDESAPGSGERSPSQARILCRFTRT